MKADMPGRSIVGRGSAAALKIVCMAAAVMLAVLSVWLPAGASTLGNVDVTGYAYTKGDFAGIDRAAKSVFYVEIYSSDNTAIGSGSGFVMFDEGLFITNQHVIDGASYLWIVDDDGRQYILDQVVISDAEHDLAILLFPEGKNYRPLPYDTDFDKLVRGQPVLAIGSPKGLPGTVSDGIISAFPKFRGEDIRRIQITAPISHGSSGGCLLNEDLKVIGVTSSGVEEGENLGFAIPVLIVEQLYRQWNKRDTVTLGTKSSWNTVGSGQQNESAGASGRTPASTAQPAIQLKKGDHVTFGAYPQTAKGNDQTPIEWVVLEVQGNKALLLSWYGLDAKVYHTESVYMTWEECSLRAWLNRDFLNAAFSADAQKLILTTTVDNGKKQGLSGWDTDGGNDTKDKIFLLSSAEANRYFGVTVNDKKNLSSRVEPTPYAQNHGATASSEYKTADGKAAGWWWLRTPGVRQCNAEFVTTVGSLGNYEVNFTPKGKLGSVRPALWIDLSQ